MEKQLQYTKQGYSYIKCNKQDCINWGGLGICDSCGKIMNESIYLIFILNQAFCKKCFNDWIDRASRYEEDIELQKENHIKWYKIHGFKIKGEKND